MSVQVKIHFEQMDKVGQAFTDQSDAVDKMNQDLQSKFDVLKNGAWIGQGADTFFEDFDNNAMQHTKKLATVLQDTADATDKIASKMHQGEENAKGHATKIGIEIDITIG